ncbi:hypothetical protein B0J11DRAFT_578497 [Dendryphion nanum]|uniref:Beta/gamma crystallin 'Greek key' domain-containing protein n=1 Tax=Dendryphion nanum TaxID=256645 RepID=A0A9P9DXG9_9PLEO|nr:hypothetical protein B0J11DRAFT_578497 [Dendryphion nanum]
MQFTTALILALAGVSLAAPAKRQEVGALAKSGSIVLYTGESFTGQSLTLSFSNLENADSICLSNTLPAGFNNNIRSFRLPQVTPIGGANHYNCRLFNGPNCIVDSNDGPNNATWFIDNKETPRLAALNFDRLTTSVQCQGTD